MSDHDKIKKSMKDAWVENVKGSNTSELSEYVWDMLASTAEYAIIANPICRHPVDIDTGWPNNICADRHEVTNKWVLHYLTDEQAQLCKKALLQSTDSTLEK